LDLFPFGTKLTNLNTKLQIQNTKAQKNNHITKSKSNFTNPNNQTKKQKITNPNNHIGTYSKFQNQTNPHTPIPKPNKSKTKQIQINKYSKTLQIQNNQIQNPKITNLDIVTDGHLRQQYFPPSIIRVNSLQSKIYKVTNKNSSRGQYKPTSKISNNQNQNITIKLINNPSILTSF
jgi:hypothetical protein